MGFQVSAGRRRPGIVARSRSRTGHAHDPLEHGELKSDEFSIGSAALPPGSTRALSARIWPIWSYALLAMVSTHITTALRHSVPASVTDASVDCLPSCCPRTSLRFWLWVRDRDADTGMGGLYRRRPRKRTRQIPKENLCGSVLVNDVMDNGVQPPIPVSASAVLTQSQKRMRLPRQQDGRQSTDASVTDAGTE